MINGYLVFAYLETRQGYEKLDTMQRIETQMFLLFMSLAVHQFEWTGLPPELRPYNLEKVLNLYGQGVIFKVGEDFVVTNAVNSSKLNIYGEPTQVNAVAMNGRNFGDKYVNTTIDEKGRVREQNGVLIKNNLYAVSTYYMLKPFIDHLCFIWESKGINCGLSRVKALVYANKSLAGTIKQEIKKIVGSRDAFPVINEKTNILKEIDKVDLNVQYEPDLYWKDFDKTFALMCQLVGITTNLSQDKKERLIVSEVESNDELTTIVEDTRLEYRKLACEKVKEIFDADWQVENKVYKVKPTTVDEEQQEEQPE